MKAPVVKLPVKASKKPVLAKPTTPVKSAKALAPVKPVKVDKMPVKAVSKAVNKEAVKPVAKDAPATKSVSKTQGVAKVAKPVEPLNPVKPLSTQIKKKPDQVTSKSQATPAVEPAKTVKPVVVVKPSPPNEPQLSSLGIPVRSGRPSSRLVQLTVPSMAQSVASTAAKASFTQVVAVQPIVPPLASAVKKDRKLANNWKTKPVAELTDDELIAMPDEEYMNETQLAFFRIKLVILKNDILSNAGETTEHLREDTVVVPDPADRATIEEEHALELRTRDRERKLLKKIEQSIGLIDAGDYGYCDETGEAIGVGRLLARPTATLSLEAQQRRELKQKMFGD